MNKLEVCRKCNVFKNNKCGLISCKRRWLDIINSKLGKCPLNKWKVNLDIN